MAPSSEDSLVPHVCKSFLLFEALIRPDLTCQVARMSSLSRFLVSFVLSVSMIPSSALPSPPNAVSGSPNELTALEPQTTDGINLQDLASPLLSYNPYCSVSFGYSPNHDSCINALSKITEGTTPMTFGERNTGSFDVILPRRYLSGTSFANV